MQRSHNIIQFRVDIFDLSMQRCPRLCINENKLIVTMVITMSYLSIIQDNSTLLCSTPLIAMILFNQGIKGITNNKILFLKIFCFSNYKVNKQIRL